MRRQRPSAPRRVVEALANLLVALGMIEVLAGLDAEELKLLHQPRIGWAGRIFEALVGRPKRSGCGGRAVFICNRAQVSLIEEIELAFLCGGAAGWYKVAATGIRWAGWKIARR